jgi:hypothetical protein
VTHIWIRKDVVNGRGIGVRHDAAAGGRDVVLESKVRVRTLPQTSPSIAAEESFPQGFDKDFNHRGAEKFAWNSKRRASAHACSSSASRYSVPKYRGIAKDGTKLENRTRP